MNILDLFRRPKTIEPETANSYRRLFAERMLRNFLQNKGETWRTVKENKGHKWYKWGVFVFSYDTILEVNLPWGELFYFPEYLDQYRAVVKERERAADLERRAVIRRARRDREQSAASRQISDADRELLRILEARLDAEEQVEGESE